MSLSPRIPQTASVRPAQGLADEARSQRLRRLRVVRDVEDPLGPARQHLEAAREPHPCEGRAHDLVRHEDLRLHGFEHRECDGGIAELGRAREARQWQLAPARAEAHVVPSVRPLDEVEVGADALEARADGGGMGDDALRQLPSAEDGRPAGAKDAGLLPADGLDRVAQPFTVIESHGHDGRGIRVEQVHGVQPSAHAHFEHGDVDAGTREHDECGQRVPFEEGQRNVAARGVDGGESRQQFGVGNFTAAHADALVVAPKVR